MIVYKLYNIICVSSTDKYISGPQRKDINVINVISRQYGSPIITFICHGFKKYYRQFDAS